MPARYNVIISATIILILNINSSYLLKKQAPAVPILLLLA